MSNDSTTERKKLLLEEMLEKFTQLITSGLALVAALAWNSAIQAIFNHYFKEGEGVKAKLIYATTITLVTVFIIYYLSLIANKIQNSFKQVKK